MNDKGYPKALDCFERIWKEGLAAGKWQDDENLKKIMYDWFLSGWLLRVQVDGIEGEVIDNGDFIKFADGKYIDLNPTMGAEPFIKLAEGDKVKVIITKE